VLNQQFSKTAQDVVGETPADSQMESPPRRQNIFAVVRFEAAGGGGG
jgi:hypothetical protein